MSPHAPRDPAGALGPAFAIHAPLPQVLDAVRAFCRVTLLRGAGSRAARETIAAVIARANRCTSCFEAHLVMLHAGGAHAIAAALAQGDDEALAPPLRTLAAWASRSLEPAHPVHRAPPFTAETAPAFIGTAVFAHYLDRLAMVLLGQQPRRGPDCLQPLRRRLAGVRHAGAWRRAARLPAEAPLGSAPAAAPSWAGSALEIGSRFARLAAALDEAGTHVLTVPVTRRVQDYVCAWTGEAPSVNRQWAERPFRNLDAAALAAGRLALLTALAPDRVDAMVIGDFRRHRPEPTALLAVVAWAAFTAAGRIGEWLAGQPAPGPDAPG